MNRIFSTLRYQYSVYVRTTRPIMPFAALMLLVGLLYAVMPVRAADSFAASATILAFISTWIGLTYVDIEDPVSEQLIVLKLGGIARYQLACTLFLVLVAAFASVLAVAIPVIGNLVYGAQFYKTPLNAATVGWALLLHLCVGFMGTATGALFHPRVFRERKVTLIIVSFVLVLGFVKIGLHRWQPLTVYLTWLFPPISEIPAALAGYDAFPVGALLGVMGHAVLYGGVLTALRIVACARLRFV